MDAFSWSDGLYAVLQPCLPCLRPTSPSGSIRNGPQRLQRTRPNELEGLLADASEPETDVETVSLHSNFGDRRRRKKKEKKAGQKKGVRIFGWDLFGKPPIQLPDSDDEEGVVGGGRPVARGRRDFRSGRWTGSSSSTLDSDAAPLDPSTIDQLSAAQMEANLAGEEEEEERRRKEARRVRKKEKKEMRRLAAALALDEADGDFEGFPGSGPGPAYGHIPSPFMATSSSQTDSQDSGFPFAGSRADDLADEDAEAADLGGELYAKRPASGNSDRGSDSRSRSSASQSNVDLSRIYNHHYASQLSPHDTNSSFPSVELGAAGAGDVNQSLLKKKKKKGSSKSKSASNSASSTSQSQSLPSPTQSSFSPSTQPDIVVPQNVPSPMSLHPEGLGPVSEGHPIESSDHLGNFPSAGFGGIRRKNSDMGVFLARRGDE